MKNGIIFRKTKKFSAVIISNESSFQMKDKTANSFIFQTVKEIYKLMKISISKKELLFEITMEWANLTFRLNENQRQDVEFRSEFRIKMMQKYSNT